MTKRFLPLVAVLTLFGAPASAYVLTGYDWSYQPTPIDEVLELNTNSFPIGNATDIENAWVAAMEEWNLNGGAPTFSFLDGGTTNNTSWASDGRNIAQYAPSVGGSTLAITQWWGWANEITDCDFEFYGSNGYGTIDWSFDPNGTQNWWEMDFQLVAEHELGHCAGFDHSLSNNAIMYFAASSGTGVADRALDSDDKQGLQAMYGAPSNANLVVSSVNFIDLGDGDGLFEPGELVGVNVGVDNDSGAVALSASSSVTTSDPDLLVVSSTGFPVTDPDHDAYTIDSYQGMEVEIDPGCTTNGQVSVDVDLAANNFTSTGSTSAVFDVTCNAASPLTVTMNGSWTPNGQADITITGALPGETIYLTRSTAGSTTNAGPCPPALGGVCVDLDSPVTLWQTLTADPNGDAVYSLTLPGTVSPGVTIWTQAMAARGVGGNQSVESNVASQTIQ